MTLAAGAEIIRQASNEHWAVAAFNTYTIESTTAICQAAERESLPVVIQIGSGAYAASSLGMLGELALAAAKAAAQPVGVHLDHSRDLSEIRSCLAMGFSSVMVDGSHLPFEDNVELTKSVVDEAHRVGAWVEAELGAVAGSENRSGNATSRELTEPRLAAEFAERTGVDVLAAAVGTVHGFTTEPVTVDIERVHAISELTGVPFALHGASGVDDGELVAAIEAGAAKVNVNAELRRAYRAGLARGLEAGGDDVISVQRAAIEAMAAVAANRLSLFAHTDAAFVGREGAR